MNQSQSTVRPVREIATLADTISLSPGIEMRKFDVSMAESLFNLVDANRAHLKWLPWIDNMKGPADEFYFLQESVRKERDGLQYGHALYCDGAIAGTCSIHRIDRDSGVFEIGYWLGSEFERRGIVTAAVREFMKFGFEVLNLPIAEIRCAEQNIPSAAVARRLGFGEPVEIIPGREIVAGSRQAQLVFQKRSDSV